MSGEISFDYLSSLADIEEMTLTAEEAVGSYALVKNGIDERCGTGGNSE